MRQFRLVALIFDLPPNFVPVRMLILVRPWEEHFKSSPMAGLGQNQPNGDPASDDRFGRLSRRCELLIRGPGSRTRKPQDSERGAESPNTTRAG